MSGSSSPEKWPQHEARQELSEYLGGVLSEFLVLVSPARSRVGLDTNGSLSTSDILWFCWKAVSADQKESCSLLGEGRSTGPAMDLGVQSEFLPQSLTHPVQSLPLWLDACRTFGLS